MKRAGLVSIALVASLLPGIGPGAWAEQRASAPPAPTEPPVSPKTPAAALDELFTRLAAAKDEEEAKGIAGLIERRWARSGSDTADLLMHRSGEALKHEDGALAVELLDRVMQLKPDWAEAWNRRATAFHSLEDPVQAMRDLQEALRREPRHFNAWLAIGTLELQADDKPRALAAFRKALKIHPHLDLATKMVERLAPDVDGRDL